MIYKKKYKIEGKIFYKKDLIRLFNGILDTFSEEMKKKDGTKEIIVNFEDGTVLKDNDTFVFEHVYIEKKKIKSIEINIGVNYCYEYVSIDLGYTNDVNIISNDKNMFDSLQHCIDENIDLTPKQYFIYLIPKKKGLIFLTLLILIAIEWSSLLFFNSFFKVELTTHTNVTILAAIPVIIVICLCEYITKYYPSIEFNFGNNSINKPKQPHKMWVTIIGFILVNIVIPLILSKFSK